MHFFKDKNGKVVIGQMPNLPLIVWFVSFLMRKLPIENLIYQNTLEAISYGSLFAWAWMELFQGVNLFRRSIGLIVIVSMIYFWGD